MASIAEFGMIVRSGTYLSLPSGIGSGARNQWNLRCLHSCMYASLTYSAHGQITLTNSHVAHQSNLTVSKVIDLFLFAPNFNLREKELCIREATRRSGGGRALRGPPYIPMCGPTDAKYE